MTVSSLYDDVLILVVLMPAGFFIREIFELVQELFLPSSLIGGLFLLLLGHQAMGTTMVPESSHELPGVLIDIVMVSLVFGVSPNREKTGSYLNYSCVTMTSYGMQMCLGVGLDWVLLKIWTGPSQGWGVMGVFSFHGGRGTAATATFVFQKLGVDGNMVVGMVLSTFGLIFAMVMGMAMVNYGIRKGWGTYVKESEKQPFYFYGGTLPREKRTASSHTVTTAISTNHLAFQISWLLIALFLGRIIFHFLGVYIPSSTRLSSVFHGVFGGAILWKIPKMTKLDRYVDIKTVKMFSGFFLEIVVFTAMTTLNLEPVSTHIVPVPIYTVTICGLTVPLIFYLFYRFCKDEWFGKACMASGAATGNIFIGLTLVRAVDSDSQSRVGDIHGAYSTIMPREDIYVGLTPVWLMNGTALTSGVGFVMTIGFAVTDFVFFNRRKHRQKLLVDWNIWKVYTEKKRFLKLFLIAAVTIVIWNTPASAGLEVETWHTMALCLGLLSGLVTKPFPEPITTLTIVGIVAMFMDTSILLKGYGNNMAWFIAMVTTVCTAFIKTELGRRIAYNLLLRSGKNTLNPGYIMVSTDLALSPATGPNSPRIGIIYPIFQNIAEGTGPSAKNIPRKLGVYLTILIYASSQGVSALFLVGMATDVITVSLITEMLGVTPTWGTWFLVSIVPVGLFLLLAPYVIYKAYPSEFKSLDDIKPFTQKGLKELGAVASAEKKLFVLFPLAILGWMFGSKLPVVNLSMQMVGFVFLVLVLPLDVLDWNDVVAAKGAWSTSIWYGALYSIAPALSSAGFYTWLTGQPGAVLDLPRINGMAVIAILVLVSLAVRYFFVSSSAFVASFYSVLFSLVVNIKTNPMVVGLLLAFFASFGALPTHYGNGAGLVAFVPDYVPQKDFRRVGTIMVAMALVIFFLIGLLYWRPIGL